MKLGKKIYSWPPNWLFFWPTRLTGNNFLLKGGPGDQKREINFCHTSFLSEPSTNWESNPPNHLVSAGSPLLSPFTISRGYWGPILPKGQKPLPRPHRVEYIWWCFIITWRCHLKELHTAYQCSFKTFSNQCIPLALAPLKIKKNKKKTTRHKSL